MKKFFAILGAFVVALSCLLIPVFSNDNYAKADSVVINSTFTSSNVIYSDLGFSSTTYPYTYDSLTYYNANFSAFAYTFQLKVVPDTSTTTYDHKVTFSLKGYNRQGSIYPIGSSYSDVFYDVDAFLVSSNTGNMVATSIGNSPYFGVQNLANYRLCFRVALKAPTGSLSTPTLVMSKVEMGNYTTIDSYGSTKIRTGYYNYVKYYDTAGWEYYFTVPLPYTSAFTFQSKPYLFFNQRTYYFSTDLSDNDYYNTGFETGYNNGLLDGYDSGYSNGYDVGNTAGYGTGYSAGLNDANQYTFFNLFGSVLDAPVTVLMSILNFQLLGVNLWALFTGLLTLAVLIFVIKLFIGGK